MKVINYRERFANNSSSSHSVCFLSDDIIPSPNQFVFGDHVQSGDFGWDNFRLDTPSEKASYFATMFREWIESACDKNFDTPRLVMNDIFGPGSYEATKAGYIDHQSTFGFPFMYEFYEGGYEGPRKVINTDYIKDLLQAFVNNENCVILGGNDNGEPPEIEGREVSWIIGEEYGSYISRKEAPFIYTMFNQANGNRMTFNMLNTEFKPNKLRSPLLVDMKITDYCVYGCKFCYQGSTKEGKHAEVDKIRDLLESLARMQVFEIAFGGGEPTQHPNFERILRTTKDFGMQANFTTFNTSFLKDEDLAKVVKDLNCSFAISNPNHGALLEIINLRQEGYNITAQFIEGVLPDYKFEELLTIANEFAVPITILGFKTSGRGAEYKKDQAEYKARWRAHTPPTDWVSIFKKFKGAYDWMPFRMACDTAFLRQHPELRSLLKKETFDMREGYQSWYIDVTSMSHGASSYEPLKPLLVVKKTGNWGNTITNIDLEASWNECEVTGQ